MRGGGDKGILLIISRLSKVAWGVLFNLRRFCQLLFRFACQGAQTAVESTLPQLVSSSSFPEIPVRDKTHVVKLERKPIISF